MAIKLPFIKQHDRVILAPWEKRFDRILTPFEQFVQRETTTGFILMAAALIALVLANSWIAEDYFHLQHISFGFHFGAWELNKSLHHWVNDGLMTIFFLVVGLELKRELLVGELADIKQASLPIIAAIGGMIVPALIFYSMNPEGEALKGWGIPMATDIAFALGVIALLAKRVPKSLITFLVALAIVDDLGAVLVIALFYTEELKITYLILGAIVTGFMITMNLAGVRRPGMYIFVGLFLWLALLKSGVHATLAGVITAFCVPTLSRFDPHTFSRRMRDTLVHFDSTIKPDKGLLGNNEMCAVVSTLKNGLNGIQTPLSRLETTMHTPVAFFILPIFAIFNAGVAINFSEFTSLFNNSVTLGVSSGLIIGKFIGIAGFSFIAIKLGVSVLPTGANHAQLAGTALLGGIGFTMSIFIAELAYVGNAALITQAKIGILSASLFAGVIGYAILYKMGAKHASSASLSHPNAEAKQDS
jgi:NhaA family Na+:H+ antiporter